MRRRFSHKKWVLPPFLPFITAFSAVILLAITPLKAGEEEWHFVYAADDITVHKRIKEDTIFLEFKSTGILRGEISNYLSVILDTENMPDWAPQCLEAQNVESINDRETIIYVACNGVWPVADRDYVAKRTITSDPEESTVRVNIVLIENPDAPVIESRVHIPYLQCCWVLKRINSSHTHVELRAWCGPWRQAACLVGELGLSVGSVQILEVSGVKDSRMLTYCDRVSVGFNSPALVP